MKLNSVGCDDVRCNKCGGNLSVWWTAQVKRGAVVFTYTCVNLDHEVGNSLRDIKCYAEAKTTKQDSDKAL